MNSLSYKNCATINSNSSFGVFEDDSLSSCLQAKSLFHLCDKEKGTFSEKEANRVWCERCEFSDELKTRKTLVLDLDDTLVKTRSY